MEGEREEASDKDAAAVLAVAGAVMSCGHRKSQLVLLSLAPLPWTTPPLAVRCRSACHTPVAWNVSENHASGPQCAV